MNNFDYINAYKTEDKIISDTYKFKDKNGTLINIDGIVNPLKIDNRQMVSPMDDQKESPHCGAYSAATIIESIFWKKTGTLVQLDSHQVYAMAKQLDGNVQMEGTYLESAMTAVMELCKKDEKFNFLNDFDIGLFYNDGTRNTIEQVKMLIHKYDFIQVGFNIDQGWNYVNNQNYHIKPCGKNMGGHAVSLCGYDAEGFYVCNQWGTQWGSKGFAIMDYNTFLKQLMYGLYIYER